MLPNRSVESLCQPPGRGGAFVFLLRSFFSLADVTDLQLLQDTLKCTDRAQREREMVNLLPTVWTVLALVGVLVLGVVMRLAKAFTLKDISPFNRFVFMVGIPCLAFKSMATRNIRALDWHFVLAFGAVRAGGCLVAAAYTLARRQALGDFAVHYLASTWMDAITFGIPVATAMFNSTVGTVYPVLAALSSFVFELPIILVSFEVHQTRIRAKQLRAEATRASLDTEAVVSTSVEEIDKGSLFLPFSALACQLFSSIHSAFSHHLSLSPHPLPRGIPDSESTSLTAGTIGGNATDTVAVAGPSKSCWSTAGRIALKVLLHVVRMPPLVGIILGIIYSALPPSLTQNKLPSAVDTFCTSVGACVTPLATFNVGLFICDGQPFKRVWKRTLVYLPLKHIALPILAIGIAWLFRLGSPAGEIAVIVASLPLAFPAFTLVHVYQGLPNADDIMSTCISAGCALLLPVVALWSLFLQKVPLFPSESSSA